jgi:hypothetical protein
MSKSDDAQIAALLRERVGYVRYDKPERVKAVDAELERLGYEAEDKPAKKSAAPRNRTAPEGRQSTAD